MKKICKFCNTEFLSEITKKTFCNRTCQQEYWRYKRNKTNDFSRRDKRIFANSVRKLKLTNKQMELVYGAMLGDSSISLSPNGSGDFRIAHGNKQKEYLEWKASIMRPFIIQETPTSWVRPEKKWNKNIIPTSTNYSYNTIIHQTFTDLYGLFYTKAKGLKRKQLNMSILNKLTPFSMLIWFLDDGCYHYQSSKSAYKMYLSTYCFTLGENKTLKRWLWHKWQIKSIIQYDKIHNSYFIRFNKEGRIRFTQLFLLPFKEQIPSCMTYKIPTL